MMMITTNTSNRNGSNNHISKKPITAIGILVIVLLLIFIIPNQRNNDELSSAILIHKQNTFSSSSFEYTCPHWNNNEKALNDNERNNITSFYHSDTVYLKERLSTILQMANSSTFGEAAFHELEFDQYQRTYAQVKEILHSWKATQFTKYIKSNMSLYESACGEGFNLLMTLSILYQQANVTNITVYGNEYRSTGVIIANELLQHMMTKVMPHSHLGQLCQGDSTNLSFIPSETFDVAYTGYIDQLQDPYNFLSNISMEWKRQAWYEICLASYTDDNDTRKVMDENDPTKTDMITSIDMAIKKRLVQMDQQKQEDWFALWVSELIRIVKPGGAVIIEQVALPKCIQLDDWGGVSKDWWKVAIHKYGWEVDETTIYMDDMFPGTENDRYHVSMQKRGKTTENKR